MCTFQSFHKFINSSPALFTCFQAPTLNHPGWLGHCRHLAGGLAVDGVRASKLGRWSSDFPMAWAIGIQDV